MKHTTYRFAFCMILALMAASAVFTGSPATAFGSPLDEVSSADAITGVNANGTNTVRQQRNVIVKLLGAGLGELDSYGSAVLVSEEGHIVTVWNHLVNTGYLTAVVSDGRRFDVDVIGTSAEHDVAVLKLRTEDDVRFPHIRLDQCQDAAEGTPVMAFSNMFHVATGNEPVSVVHGIVACKTVLNAGLGRWEFPVDSPVLIIDAITNNSGAAGGLLTLTDGTPTGLLGREIRHRESGTWVNYAVPLTTLRPVIESLIAGKPFDSGVRSSNDPLPMISDRELTSKYGLTLLPSVLPRTPAFIDAVVPQSAAAQAGFQRGDLIVLVDDDVIQSVTDFRRQVRSRRSGQTMSVIVNRQDALITLSLTVQ